jgi:hypothetical protein
MRLQLNHHVADPLIPSAGSPLEESFPEHSGQEFVIDNGSWLKLNIPAD